MQHVTAISDLALPRDDDDAKEKVVIHGWIDKIRSQKKLAFIELRDGVGKKHRIQVVIQLSNPLTEQEQLLKKEAYIEVTGQLTALPPQKYSNLHPFELQCDKFTILGLSSSDFSLKCPKEAKADVKLELRHLYIRENESAITISLRDMLVQAIRKTFAKTMKMTEIFPPCFVSNQCEGGATLFKLKYPPSNNGDDIDAYLTQSSQFYLEMAIPAVGDNFCIYPSFRAERSHTRRHLTEFLHAECEWKDVMTFEAHLEKLRQMLKSILTEFLKLDDESGLLQEIGRREAVEGFLQMPIVTLTHQEAIKYCQENDIYADEEKKIHFGPRDDIPEKQERMMIDKINKIVLLSKFPKEFKSFYMATDPIDPSYALGVDVEVPSVGEIIGSGVRVYQTQELLDRLKENGLHAKDYEEYIDLRRYGSGRTSGCGLGVDRLLTWLLGSHSIRDVVTFPRYPGRLTP